MFETKRYHFDLPETLIANSPLQARDQARLMVVHKKSKKIEHAYIHELTKLIPAHTTIVANNTKVFPARLRAHREESGGKVEFFLLKKVTENTWTGLMKTGSKVVPGFRFVVDGPNAITAEVIERNDTPEGAIFTARFSKDPVEAGVGEVPLPPYIMSKRKDLAPNELEIYNTVFAREEGSVAAPTAGRHFTPELIQKLRAAGHEWNEITLHVGLGTFKPVSATDVREHTMHAESTLISEVAASAINSAKRQHRTLLAIGTTTTRALEGRALQLSGTRNPGIGDAWISAGAGDVNLFIHPGSGHQWRIVDAMLTNFHLPESTLLMMIAEFIGDLEFTKRAYQEAIAKQYRFFSYGDAMLILDQ